MTAMQSIMLSVIFGATIGTMIGELSWILWETWKTHKEKKHRKKEEAGQGSEE